MFIIYAGIIRAVLYCAVPCRAVVPCIWCVCTFVRMFVCCIYLFDGFMVASWIPTNRDTRTGTLHEEKLRAERWACPGRKGGAKGRSQHPYGSPPRAPARRCAQLLIWSLDIGITTSVSVLYQCILSCFCFCFSFTFSFSF